MGKCHTFSVVLCVGTHIYTANKYKCVYIHKHALTHIGVVGNLSISTCADAHIHIRTGIGNNVSVCNIYIHIYELGPLAVFNNQGLGIGLGSLEGQGSSVGC
jgi:hypothetical protein